MASNEDMPVPYDREGTLWELARVASSMSAFEEDGRVRTDLTPRAKENCAGGESEVVRLRRENDALRFENRWFKRYHRLLEAALEQALQKQ